MDAARIRELVARREGEKLDFKKQQFARDKGGAAELARDIMAMANALRSDDEPAHILVGVEEVEPEKTGRIVGIAAEECEDDAHIQQRVGSLLNRTPSFSFEAVEVDKLLVGAYVVRAGGRPYFPLKDSGDGPRDKKTLLRHVALVRRGTSTDVASPSEIIEWARRDDPGAQELRELELREKRLATAIQPLLKLHGGGVSGGPDSIQVHFDLKNEGAHPFRVTEAVLELRFGAAFRRFAGGSGLELPEELPTLRCPVDLPSEALQPQGKERFGIKVPATDIRRVLSKAAVAIGQDFDRSWFYGELIVVCRDAGGAEVMRNCSFGEGEKIRRRA